MNSECDFCLEADSALSYFSRLYCHELVDRIVSTSDNFICIPSIGQITNGHLLIVSRHHYTALAQLPDTELGEVENMISAVEDANRRLLDKETVVFEHGMLDPSRGGGCGISHLHVHLVPSPDDTNILPAALRGLRFERIDSLRSLARYRGSGVSYVFLRQPRAGDFIGIAKDLPSQYMRKVMAQTLGKSEWDWRKFGVEDDLISTYRFYRKALSGSAAHEPSEPVGSVANT